MRGLETKAKKIWEHPWMGPALCVIAFGVSIWLVFWPQTPGIAMALLGTVAVVMAIRKISARGKILYTVVVFILLISEIRAIRQQNKQFIDDRKKLNDKFSEIKNEQRNDLHETLSKLQASVDANQTQFKETIGDINKTLLTTQNALKSAQSAELNTTPRANIEMQHILSNRTLSPSGQFSSLTASDFIGQKTLTMEYINAGTTEANEFWLLGRLYPGVPDNLAEQIRIATQFGYDWEQHKVPGIAKVSIPPSRMLTSGPIFSPGLSDAQLDDFRHGKLTMYFFVRFAYTDKTGKWYRDNCGWFDYSETAITWARSCSITEPSRYPAPPQ